jgi:acetolactate synthase-1/2/3 large subunit
MPGEQKVPMYGSDLIVDILREHGLEYVTANIGSTFRGLWDSLINYGGDTAPKCISVCHEEIAVAIAHGYAKAAGKPMVALVHDTVGLQHASMAIFNAWCDRVPVIILAASGPMDSTKRRPWIDWIHTAVIPNDIVRNYVKWDDFPFSISSVPDSFARAYNAATRDPNGPVFLCLDVGYLEQKLEEPINVHNLKQKNHPLFPSVDADSLQGIANLLVNAENPFIIAGRVGRNKCSVKSLVELAEITATSVFDTLERFNFPNTHPLDVPDKEDIADADVILVLDAPNLGQVLASVNNTTRKSRLIVKPDVKITKVGLDDLLTKSWAADYQQLVPAEISIIADTSTVIPKLVGLCRDLIHQDYQKKKKISERFQRAKANYQKKKENWGKDVRRRWDAIPISLPRLAGELWKAVRGKSWVIANGTLGGWVRRIWAWEEPGCYLGGSGGAGLGYGLPASIGVSLGFIKEDKKRIVIDFQPDGDLLYTPSALWTAAHYHLPLLVVMFNNRMYYNDAEHNRLIAQTRNRDSERVFHTGGDISDPYVDFAELARSFGVQGEGPIENPQQVGETLARALNTVEVERKPVLVDVVTESR